MLVPEAVKALAIPRAFNFYNFRRFRTPIDDNDWVTLLDVIQQFLAVLGEHVKLRLPSHIYLSAEHPRSGIKLHRLRGLLIGLRTYSATTSCRYRVKARPPDH